MHRHTGRLSREKIDDETTRIRKAKELWPAIANKVWFGFGLLWFEMGTGLLALFCVPR
jgi:hypothetical protein